jgi:hypothetical protein
MKDARALSEAMLIGVRPYTEDTAVGCCRGYELWMLFGKDAEVRLMPQVALGNRGVQRGRQRESRGQVDHELRSMEE